MWDAYRLHTIGDFSLRKIATALVAVIVSAFLWVIAVSPTTHAADAQWKGESITYQNRDFTKTQPPQAPDFPNDTSAVYQYTEPGNPEKAHLIFFPQGADTATATTAQYKTYTLTNGVYSNPSSTSTISIDAKGGPPGANGEEEKKTVTCDVRGIGWIICPVSRFIADGMDRVFGWIASYLEVNTITTDTNSSMYRAWEIMRGFANICFVLAFLIIIYAQLASVGLNNYEIKRMIPKLIIASILVNLSYYICSIAVDLSNISGYALQQTFRDIQNSLGDSTASGNFDATSWKNITEYILTGGTAGVGAVLGIGALLTTTGGSITAMIFLLFPILVAGILAVLVALLVLAARQALITILIIVAPLAFVAYLLPNTEKWFEKWREIMTTMLLVFPIFSMLFGGSQLAAYLILQNANQFSVVLLALAVQVAPLAITPFLIKFSGSLLGRVAGMVNNPNKGLIDRTRNFANERVANRASRATAQGAQQRNRAGLRAMAYRREMNRRKREEGKKLYDTEMDANWHNSRAAHAIETGMKAQALRKAVGEAAADEIFERRKASSQSLQRLSGMQRQTQASVKQLQQADEAKWQESLSREMGANNQYAAFAPAARAIQEQQRIADSKVAAAQAMQKIEYANDLIKSEALQQAAGGIAKNGADRVLASAVSEYRKDYNDRINEANAILKHYNLSGAQRQAHALGQEIDVTDENGNMKILRADSVFTREAAIDEQLKTATYKDVEAIVQRSGSELAAFKTTIASGVAANKLSSKGVFLGGKTIDDIGQGRIGSEAELMVAVTSTIAKGKISAADLVSNDADALERIFKAAVERKSTGLSTSEAANLDASIAALKKSAQDAMTQPTLSRDLKENARKVLEKFNTIP